MPDVKLDERSLPEILHDVYENGSPGHWSAAWWNQGGWLRRLMVRRGWIEPRSVWIPPTRSVREAMQEESPLVKLFKEKPDA